MEWIPGLRRIFGFLIARRFIVRMIARLFLTVFVLGIVGVVGFSFLKPGDLKPSMHMAFDDMQMAIDGKDYQAAVAAGSIALKLSKPVEASNRVYVGQIEKAMAESHYRLGQVDQALASFESAQEKLAFGTGPCEPVNELAKSERYDALLQMGEISHLNLRYEFSLDSYVRAINVMGTDLLRWDVANQSAQERLTLKLTPLLEDLESTKLDSLENSARFFDQVVATSLLYRDLGQVESAMERLVRFSRRAVESNVAPSSETVRLHVEAATYLAEQGRHDEAIFVSEAAYSDAHATLEASDPNWTRVYLAIIEAIPVWMAGEIPRETLVEAAAYLSANDIANGELQNRLIRLVVKGLEDSELNDTVRLLRIKYPDVFDEVSRGIDDKSAREKGYTSIQVLYGTTRQPIHESDGTTLIGYGPERVESGGYRGRVEVSIPLCHKKGEFEAVGRLERLEVKPNPLNHIVMHRPNELDDQAFETLLRDELSSASADAALIYVHGFNVRFSEAATRTAQLAFDLEFGGVSSFYSWPSRGQPYAYTHDANVSDVAINDMEKYLDQMISEAGPGNVNLIVHSLGTKYLIRALRQMSGKYQSLGKPVFNQVILAAPDIDASNFRTNIPHISFMWKKMTVYASKNDWTMDVSEQINGHPRLGGADPIVTIAGVQTVDSSLAETGMTGHSYYSDDLSIMTDIRALIWHGLEPSDRCFLVEDQKAESAFWVYKPDRCSVQAFDYASALVHQHGKQSAMDRLRALDLSEETMETSIERLLKKCLKLASIVRVVPRSGRY